MSGLLNGFVLFPQGSTFINMSTDRFHLALDGKTWNAILAHYPKFIPNIIARGTIFARFRPEQKSQIVVQFQQYDYIVAMCGDGANDCGALKVSHARMREQAANMHLNVWFANVCPPFT